jgi:Rieske Fe-S protein
MGTIDPEQTGTTQESTGRTSRRKVLIGVGAVGAAASVVGLAACASGGPGTSSSGANGGAAVGSDTNLTKSSDIPVGGGKIFADQQVVVVQPTAGEFKAFSAVCTHMGCTVSSVSNGVIVCPCHGSEYAIADGSVKRGPASSPLPAKQVTVTNGEVSVA